MRERRRGADGRLFLLLGFAVNLTLKKRGSVRRRLRSTGDDFGESWTQKLKKPKKKSNKNF